MNMIHHQQQQHEHLLGVKDMRSAMRQASEQKQLQALSVIVGR